MKITNALPARLAWFAGLWAFVFLLKGIGEFYPFSHFPMYSGLADHADVLFVETESGERLPVLTVFGKRESRCKKIWMSELRAIANAQGRHSGDATPEDLRLAGERLLARLLAERYAGRLEAYDTRQLHLVQRRITLEPSGELVSTDATIATVPVESSTDPDDEPDDADDEEDADDEGDGPATGERQSGGTRP